MLSTGAISSTPCISGQFRTIFRLFPLIDAMTTPIGRSRRAIKVTIVPAIGRRSRRASHHFGRVSLFMSLLPIGRLEAAVVDSGCTDWNFHDRITLCNCFFAEADVPGFEWKLCILWVQCGVLLVDLMRHAGDSVQDDPVDNDEGSDADVEGPVRCAEWNLCRVLWEFCNQERNAESVHQEGAEDVQATES